MLRVRLDVNGVDIGLLEVRNVGPAVDRDGRPSTSGLHVYRCRLQDDDGVREVRCAHYRADGPWTLIATALDMFDRGERDAGS